MLTIDRIEEGIAVCEREDGGWIYLRTYPMGAKEGDLLRQTENGWEIDADATAWRREQILRRTEKIRSRRRRE